MGRKRHFNEKARQQGTHTARRSASEIVEQTLVGAGVSRENTDDSTRSDGNDTNVLALLPRSKDVTGDKGGELKRRKLTQKQKKRLQKIVESKERKAKVNFLTIGKLIN